ncbi:MAG: Lysylphosphatidylglycerol synthetase/glycosyltransferase AglD, partial [Gemmatimonadetes bacterium]|nr:Lysylphosphatidylglycerol synthetase/glycosyltransferase AglD [Gemmatimonadota bacterium]
MKFGWRSALGIVLSAVLLYLAFKDIEFAKVVENIRKANLGLLILSAATATLTFPLRARRWRPILDPVAPKLPFGALWRATAIGMMLNNVAPARAGEPARAYALSRFTPKVSFPAAFASLAVDRLFDMVVILVLMFGAMLDPAFPSGAKVFGFSMSSIAVKGLALVSVALVGMYAMVLFPARVLALYELVARRIAPKLEEKGRVALVALMHGLSVLRSPSRFAAIFAWTVLHWLVNGLAFWIGFKAVGIDAPYSSALFLQGVIAIGVAAPQAPGFFGVFELFGKEGLRLYGVGGDAAVTWAISFHFLSFLPITFIGGWY